VEAAHRSGLSVGQWLNHVLAENLEDDILDEPAPRRGIGSRRDDRHEMLGERIARLGGRRAMTAIPRHAAPRAGTENSAVLDLIESAVQAIERLEKRQPDPSIEQLPDLLRSFERKIENLVTRESARPLPGAFTPSPVKPVSHPDEDAAFSRIIAEIEARRRDLDGTAAPITTASLATETPLPDHGHIAAMRSQLDTLVTRIDEMRARPAPDAGPLQARLDDLTRRIEQWRAGPSEEIAALRRDLSGIVGALEAISPNRLVGMVENAVTALGQKAYQAGREGLPERVAEPLERIHEDIRAVLREVSSSQGHDRISQEVSNLARRLDLIAEGTADTGRLAEISRETAAIKTLVSQAMRAQPLDGLTRQIEILSEQIDGFRRAPSSGDRQVLDAIRDVGDRLERITPASAFAGIEARLGAITGIEEKLGEIARGMKKLAKEAQPLPQLENIAERLERIDRVLDKGDGMALAGLDQLTQRLDKLDITLERAGESRPADHETLVAMLDKLSRRIDDAATARAESPALDALQDEIARLAGRMEKIGGHPVGLDNIERGVSDLFAQIDLARQDMREAAENAATRAASEALRNAPRDESSETLAAEGLLLIKRDLSEFKSAQSDADRRTRQTLEALHSTLETLVGRLSDIETRAPVMRQAAPPPAMPSPAVQPAARASFEPIPPEAQPTPAAPVEGDVNAPDMRHDLPLEPGIQPGSPAADVTKSDPRSTFIAAARRVAQNAAETSQAALAEEKGRRPRDKARETEPLTINDGGMTSFIVKARKPLLLGLAAIVFSVGALKVINTRTPSPPKAPGIEQPVSPSGKSTPDQDPRGDNPQTTGSVSESAPSAEGQALPLGAPITGKRGQRLAEGNAIFQSDPIATGSLTPDGGAKPIERGRAALEELANQSNLKPQDKLREAALQGNVAALHELGARHADGRNAPRDPKLAARWFEQAAIQGHGPSQYRLGSLYREGRGVAKDAALAFQWFDRAAAQGHILAMHNAAVLLAEGVQGAPDYAGAALWFKRAAEHGVKDSQFNVAILFARGLGVNQDLAESYRWFAIAAAQGDPDAGKKRDDIGGRLTKDQIAKENDRVKAFKPLQPNAAANDPGTWDKPAKAGT